jgi:hypothetical protein
MLGYCNNCKEASVVVRCYKRAIDEVSRRVCFCINKGCGWRQELNVPDYADTNAHVGGTSTQVHGTENQVKKNV